jgi:4-nitrophenyl phosphatase
MDELNGLILDMDGVLWRGSEPMPGLRAFFETLGRLGIPFALATNNSTRSTGQYVEKLAAFGIAVEPDQIVTSAYATADYLLEEAGPGVGVYMVGEEGLRAALTSRGFRLIEDGAQYVVAGMDRGINYEKLVTAMELIGAGARFIGTNPDRTFPTPEGLRPGAGTVLAAIAAASGVEPVIIGKPEPPMIQQALRVLGTATERTAIVGDRLETDILAGKKGGIRTILVLSGVAQREHLAESEIQPDWVVEDIRALAAVLSGDAN